MKTDLLRAQIDACHKHHIKVPIYVTVQWDHYTANEVRFTLIFDRNTQRVIDYYLVLMLIDCNLAP